MSRPLTVGSSSSPAVRRAWAGPTRSAIVADGGTVVVADLNEEKGAAVAGDAGRPRRARVARAPRRRLTRTSVAALAEADRASSTGGARAGQQRGDLLHHHDAAVLGDPAGGVGPAHGGQPARPLAAAPCALLPSLREGAADGTARAWSTSAPTPCLARPAGLPALHRQQGRRDGNDPRHGPRAGRRRDPGELHCPRARRTPRCLASTVTPEQKDGDAGRAGTAPRRRTRATWSGSWPSCCRTTAGG